MRARKMLKSRRKPYGGGSGTRRSSMRKRASKAKSKVMSRKAIFKAAGGAYRFDLAAPPIGGLAEVVPYNDYFLTGAGKKRSRKHR